MPSPCGAAVTIESTSSRWDRASLPRRAREELDRLAAERAPALEGPMEPARDRLMRAEERAGAGRRGACIATGQAAPWLPAPLPELKRRRASSGAEHLDVVLIERRICGEQASALD